MTQQQRKFLSVFLDLLAICMGGIATSFVVYWTANEVTPVSVLVTACAVACVMYVLVALFFAVIPMLNDLTKGLAILLRAMSQQIEQEEQDPRQLQSGQRARQVKTKMGFAAPVKPSTPEPAPVVSSPTVE